jgi:hypothetical protein
MKTITKRNDGLPGQEPHQEIKNYEDGVLTTKPCSSAVLNMKYILPRIPTSLCSICSSLSQRSSEEPSTPSV